MALTINELKAYVPAKDIDVSKRFYSALGFEMSEGWGGTLDVGLNGHRFRLQSYYVKEWAENFMIVIDVDDIEAWHRAAKQVVEGGEFENIRLKPPERLDNALVLHVVDPSGVLLIFVQ